MARGNDKDILLYAVGDVGPNREDPDSMFRYVRPILTQGDIVFCQLEPVLSRRGSPLPQARTLKRPESQRSLNRKGPGLHFWLTTRSYPWDIGPRLTGQVVLL
jgi:hypothetical protein